MTILAPPDDPRRSTRSAGTGHDRHAHGLDWSAARRQAWVIGTALPGSIESVDLLAAPGRVLAQDLRAGAPLPGFDAAAMDGWALGPGGGPWRVGDPVPMGSAPDPSPLTANVARPITTGGPVPAGTITVLRSEDGIDDGGLLRAIREPAGGAHIRRSGEEAEGGEVLVRAGTVLTPPHCALLAAGGHDLLPVRRRPRTAILTLGDEVLQAGVPSPGSVRDVFGPSIPPIVAAFGAIPGGIGAAADDLRGTVAALEEALGGATGGPRADVVVTTGGTADGDGDHLRAALGRVGARIVIDGVAVRPGRPVLLATLADGRAVLGVPGNPMAGLLCLVALGGALLTGALGRPLPSLGAALAAEALPNPTRSTRLVACVNAGPEGVLPLGRQGSAMLRGLAAAEVVVVVPPGGVAAGATVETLPLPW